LSLKGVILTAAGAEGAEGAQRNTDSKVEIEISKPKPLRFLCALCACGGELSMLYAQE
jgi:hypothetical protein